MSSSHEPLVVASIAAALGDFAARFDVDVLAECDSTNAELLRRAERGAASGSVVVAERQTAGRGRRGRSWHSAPADSLTFSLLWRMPDGVRADGLSLAVGVALAETLGETARLKWPNDILLEGRKLGGILVELTGRAAVIGIGLNLRLPGDMPDEVRTGAAALESGESRNALLARLLTALHVALEEFTAGGFVALRTRWLARCGHLDMPVRILSEFSVPLEGRCVGVDVDGALLLETPVCVQRIVSGEVSLRLA
jgi:BirA family biotin operon repressor/biotin-[acetyl-CoA-carboxylase] ligase